MSKADQKALDGGFKKGAFKRDKATIKRLKIANDKPTRTREGKIIYQAFQSHDKSHKARVEPNRKWFGPVRTVSQTQMTTFREELKKNETKPYEFLLKSSKVPYSLLRDSTKEGKANLLEVEKFEDTFGKKSTRKRPRLSAFTIEDLAQDSEKKFDSYVPDKDERIAEKPEFRDLARENIFTAGQSSRIWNELYKVVDSSDVILQVLDARDPVGTRCKHIEKHIKKNCPHKHMIFVLNKCDLIPTWATKRWLHILGKEYPIIAFHASVTKSFGKGSLINLLRQFQRIHKDKPQISVGFIGYPNVGKSSIINTLKKKNVCKVAPIPGETKVWQYITLFRKVFLIDCPGVVTPAKNETEANIVLRGCLRVENIEEPSQYVKFLLERVKKEHMQKTYGIMEWEDDEDFLEQYALKTGKLLKKGDPDINAVGRMILNDWIRGKIPYFVCPPDIEDFVETRVEVPTVPTKEEWEAKMSIKEEPKDEPKKDVTPGLKSQPTKKEVKVPAQEIDGMRVRKEFEEDADGVSSNDEENDDAWDNITESESDDSEDEEEDGGAQVQQVKPSRKSNNNTNSNAIAVDERNEFEEGSNKKRKKNSAEFVISNDQFEIDSDDVAGLEEDDSSEGEYDSDDFESGDSDDVGSDVGSDIEVESGDEDDWEEAMRSVKK